VIQEGSTMTAARPFAWEKAYPAGVRWDAPIETTTVPEILARSVARFPNAPALTFGPATLSFKQFGDHVAAMAAAFAGIGVAVGTPVALWLPNVPWHPIAFFAALRCGGRVVHVSPLDAEREIVHKLKDSGARILLVSDIVPAMVEGARKLLAAGLVDRVIVGETGHWLGKPATTVTDDRVLSASALLATPPRDPASYPTPAVEDVALYQYTGGTTGLPKAALLTHANLTAALSIARNWGEPQGIIRFGDDASVLVLPLFHIFALLTMLGAVQYGNHTVLHPRFDPEAVVRDIERYRPTGFSGVPTMWIAIANLPGIEQRDLSSLKFARSGGAAAPVEIEKRIKAITGVQLGGGWGMTETAPVGTTIPISGPIVKGGTIGIPLPGIEMDIVALDDPRRRLGVGETGEIRIKGPNVIRAYHNRPEENAASFVDGYLLTGDIGHMDADGFFFIVDRKKDMIISGGFNVYPRHIEEAIFEHPDVAEVIVIGVPDDYRGEAAKAFVALKPGRGEFSLDALRTFLADKLGRHELPAHLEFRPTLPKTAVGKLSKKELVAEERAKRAAPQGAT
jgi:long-chain acyl-CoA synthetase